MAENADTYVPSSFDDLKARARAKIRRGDPNVQQDIVAMGDAMLQAGVEPTTAEDRVAKRVWQSAQPHHKQALAAVVAKMAAEEDEDGTETTATR
jgi:hypothetical protein